MIRLASAGLAALLAATALAADSGPRIRENFNQGWLFARQTNGSGALGSFDRDTAEAARVEPRFRNAAEPGYDDSSWQKIALPHTWNAHDVMDEVPGYWRGIGWYRKHFQVDRRYAARRIFLEFDGANQVAEFWLNGARLGVHNGGYTGFEFDITAQVRFGEDNVLTAKVDNLYHASIPPTVKTDYSFYGGIYRDVWLRMSSPMYIERANWTTPTVSAQSAVLAVETRVRNETGTARHFTLTHEILDPQGKVVATLAGGIEVAANATAQIGLSSSIDHPRLWSPDAPNLYSIRSTLHDGAQAVDAVANPLGFRWFHFDPQRGFFLNGQRVQIQGVNWHQSYPGMGNALPNSRHWKDMQLIREMGCNFWRTSHYPHAPATMDASDRLGLMVWEELPINKEIGDPPVYIRNALTMAREMITRDRNHPSVIVWGFAGEVNAPQAVSRQVVSEVARVYRELDPSRPVAMHEPRGEDIESLVDVSGLGADTQTDDKHARFPDRAYMTAEYSASLMGRGIYGGGPESEEIACTRHEQYLRQIARRTWLAGGCIWNAFDYDGESYDAVIPHIVAFGMTDIWRIPKEVFYFYQSQWSAMPMIHIVGHWTWSGQENRRREVKVYSNAPEVELFLNGRSLGVKKDEPEVAGLAHPPRVWEVQYQPGVLRAVARFSGAELADERKTAGSPQRIVLTSDAAELRSGDSESLAYLTAAVVDQDNTPVPGASVPITFTSYGPGELLPQTWPGHATGFTWNAIAGMTRIAFRSTARTGDAVISAYSPGLAMGRTIVKVTSPGKPSEMDYQERFAEDETPVILKAQ
jgi:beta-galactosidase